MKMMDISELAVDKGTMEISQPTICKPGSSLILSQLTFKDSGALIIYGECTLKIETLNNYKEEHSECNYEFLIAGENGRDAAEGENGGDAKNAGVVDISINTVCSSFRVNAIAGNGGNGWDGVDGICGGNGGDGYEGGAGGSGGDAAAGTNGGSGGDAPAATLVYGMLKTGASIFVNGEKIRKDKELILPGGSGGKGGKACAGGKGGKGGKGITPSLNGAPGKDGKGFDTGHDGTGGKDGKLMVKRKPLEVILENLQGLYMFDFSIDEDRNYFLQEIGGVQALQDTPLIKAAYEKAVARAQKNAESGNEEIPPIQVEAADAIVYQNDKKLLKDVKGDASKYGVMGKTFAFTLYDNKTSISNPLPALPWKSFSVSGRVVNMDDPSRRDTISVHLEYTNSNGGTKEFLSEPELKDYFIGTFKTKLNVRGVDINGLLHAGVYNHEDLVGDEVIHYTVTNIRVNDPHWNGKHDNHIVMLYGRMDILEEYKDPDYIGGEYYNNTFKLGNKVSTLIPVTGEVTFDSGFELVGLTPPDDLGFSRSSVDYENKTASSMNPDVVYQNDLIDNDKLYALMNAQCFKPHPGVANPYIEFDLRLDRGDSKSKLDWHDDIQGEKDNHKRTIWLRAVFTYSVHKKTAKPKDNDDVQICIRSISKEDLDIINKNKDTANKREYYKFLEGSNTIYIPPIYLYWGCFGKNVRIKTVEGTDQKACEIKIGDRLMAYGGKTVTVKHIITGQDEEIYRLNFADRETKLSGAHPVLDENGESIAANQLKAGDRLMAADGASAELLSVEKISYCDTVYNFAFEDETESVYVIADGLYAGDLNAQNESVKIPELSPEDIELSQRLLAELQSLGT
jgi:hypothetical protein